VFGSVISGLLSAASFGTADFLGGFASKNNHPTSVIITSQFFGFLTYLVLILITQEPLSQPRFLLLGACAGLFGCIGLNALFRGLANGKMSLIAPVSAVLTATIPVIYSLLTIGAPPVYKFIGFGLALVAVWMISASGNIGKVSWRDLVLPILAGTCFGITFILLGEASKGSTYWSLLFVRIVSLSIMLVVAIITRQRLTVGKASLFWVMVSGVLDALGNLFFAFANQTGRLDIATVLSALYPTATVLLAWLVLKEKISRNQWLGVLLALIAIFLITV
jgi:drug/metabolite transporter (DMT)-like permease